MLRELSALAAVIAVVAVGSTSDAGAQRQAAGALVLRVWVDQGRAAAVERLVRTWAPSSVDIQVVPKEFASMRDDLGAVTNQEAPDIIVAPHDWTGQLAVAKLVAPLGLTPDIESAFAPNVLDGFLFGTAKKALYGLPVSVENVALVVDTRLAHVPSSFDDLRSQALAFKARQPGNVALAVPQGRDGDAYDMEPFFSGLCGYLFGRNAQGNVDPARIGVADPSFLANSRQIDTWNRDGLIQSAIGYDEAKAAFLDGRAAFWVTGPWESAALSASGLPIAVVPFPRIACDATPFLGVQGFMVTTFAREHGVDALATDFVGRYMVGADAQAELGEATGRTPANRAAAARVTDPLLAAFGRAGAAGAAMPNIPEMAGVWAVLGAAWRDSTSGPGATPGREAFIAAAKLIAEQVGLPPPPPAKSPPKYGVVDSVSIKPIPDGLEVTFRFRRLPVTGSRLKTVWYRNNGLVGEAAKKRSWAVTTFVRVEGGLPRGFWRCALMVKTPGAAWREVREARSRNH